MSKTREQIIQDTTGMTPYQQQQVERAGGVFHVDESTGEVCLDLEAGKTDVQGVADVLNFDNVKSNR